ncbi:hypothetical protein TTHERM_00725840 (macronuclear) [Tetrahymena thermophila SB210]|uniref:PH domain-containing protein n=1 Tax=Tetrahymena thermophila (strain SB210) TaxID=312017 RepID=Q24GK6_TETTS|nr:hypothetical protein TTHERM_00725840 [Tetrahymena thermophila SB210]EAS06865.2 hypothetical protein TTHERM_00725840 [Tetrahymena thermophila SB210]|eukprot:XP_001027107.2 hypothetical protein TTHERM_00725840 [Tetrahymena thermophila SB210]
MIQNKLNGVKYLQKVTKTTEQAQNSDFQQKQTQNIRVSSVSLSPKRMQIYNQNQNMKRQGSLTSLKFNKFQIFQDYNQKLKEENFNTPTNFNRSLDPTEIDEQDLYDNNRSINRISNSTGEKRFSQSDDGQSNRSSQDLQSKLNYYSNMKEAYLTNSLSTQFDADKISGRNNTDKTISTCISYKSHSNRQSKNIYSNNHSSCALNQRCSSQQSSYCSHFNINSSQSPCDASPRDTCSQQVNNDKQNSTGFYQNIQEQSQQNSPYIQYQQDQAIPQNSFCKQNSKETFQQKASNSENLIYQKPYQENINNLYLSGSKSDKYMASSNIYNNSKIGCNNSDLHRIKEEAESDTQSIYSCSVRLRHTPPSQNSYDRKVSNNKDIQQKVVLARQLLRSQQSIDSINLQKLSNQTSPKSQNQKEDYKNQQQLCNEEAIYLYTQDLLANSIQIDYKQNQNSSGKGLVRESPKESLKEQKIDKYGMKEDNFLDKKDQDFNKSQLLGMNGEQNVQLIMQIQEKTQNEHSMDINQNPKYNQQNCDQQLNQINENQKQPQTEMKNNLSQSQQQLQIKDTENQEKSQIWKDNQQLITNSTKKNELTLESISIKWQKQQSSILSEANQSVILDFDRKNISNPEVQVITPNQNLKTELKNVNIDLEANAKQREQNLSDQEERSQQPPPLITLSSSLIKNNQLNNFQSQVDDFTEFEVEYERIKQFIINNSQKLLEKKTLTAKFPIYKLDEIYQEKNSFIQNSQTNFAQNTNPNLKVFEETQLYSNTVKSSQNSPINLENDQQSSYNNFKTQQQQQQNKQQTSYLTNRCYSQRFSLGSPTSYITNIDNMIFHLFTTPQKTVTQVLKEVDLQSVICQDQLSKKIPGIIDRWKKKYLFLYLDKLCYQENQNSRVSTISFKHFDYQISKDVFRNTFTLLEQNTKKKFTFKCQDSNQNEFWVQTIADIIIFNQMFAKYKLNNENALLYQKQQVCFPNEVQSILQTGDLIIYRVFNQKSHKPEKKLEVALIIKTQFITQVCFYSQDEGILTLPLDTFLTLFNLASLSFRRLERVKQNDEKKNEDDITSTSVEFVQQHQQNNFKDSNHLVFEILKASNVLKEKTTSKILYDRDIFETNRLNLYTQNCSYSDLIYLVLKNHINAVLSNPPQLNSIFKDTSYVSSDSSQIVNLRFAQEVISPVSNMNSFRTQSIRQIPHSSSMFQTQEYHNEEGSSSFGSRNNMFRNLSYIEFGKEFKRNSFNCSSLKYL